MHAQLLGRLSCRRHSYAQRHAMDIGIAIHQVMPYLSSTCMHVGAPCPERNRPVGLPPQHSNIALGRNAASSPALTSTSVWLSKTCFRSKLASTSFSHRSGFRVPLIPHTPTSMCSILLQVIPPHGGAQGNQIDSLFASTNIFLIILVLLRICCSAFSA